jgi:hypothetical protein
MLGCTGVYGFPFSMSFKGKNHSDTKKMQNNNVVSGPEFNAYSKSALEFPGSFVFYPEIAD